MKYEEIIIQDEFITLGQLLKLANIFDSGGMIKSYIQNEGVLINDEVDHRRGKKLYHGDTVKLMDYQFIVVANR